MNPDPDKDTCSAAEEVRFSAVSLQPRACQSGDDALARLDSEQVKWRILWVLIQLLPALAEYS